MRQVDGPIGIGSAVGAAAREEGWTPLLSITAAISLNLGIMNLLPIPILDGGVILLLFIESLMQKEISLAIKERIYQAAFVFLVLFAVMVIYNDIVKTLPGITIPNALASHGHSVRRAGGNARQAEADRSVRPTLHVPQF